MDSIKIYSSDGALLIDAVLEDSSAQDWGIMSENQVSLDFYTDECIILPASCYIDYEGQRFWLLDEYKPTENNSAEWSYQVRFLGAESLLAVTVVLNQTDGSDEPIFNLTAPASQHLEFIVSNLNRRFPGMGWSVGSVPSTENIFIEYAGTYASDALQTIVGDKYEWWVDDFVVNIGRCEFGERIELGYQNGLLGGITYSTANEMRSYAYLYPIGSARNIDPSKYGYSRLQLPDGLTRIDINPEQGLAELVESDAFADIFPRYVGKVTAVRTSSGKNEDGTSFTIYHIKDSSIPFNPNNYEIAGEVKQITFQSGELRGAEFEVNYDADNKEFEIITQFQNGGLSQLPGGALIPEVGDKYVVWNISMPDEYYPLAEQEFLQAALAFASESVKEASVYRAPVDFIEVQQRGLRLRPGQRVRLLSNEYFPDKGYYDSRITRITRDVCYPDEITIEVSSVVSKGTISRLRNSVNDSATKVASLGQSLKNYVDITSAQSIFGAKNFVNGFTLAGVKMYRHVDGYVYLDETLVLKGGVVMYGNGSGAEVPSIFDSLPIDGRTIKRDGNGALYVDETALSISGGGGGVADSVYWNNVIGKPSWIGSTKPTYKYSEIEERPDLSVYFLKTSFTKDNIKSTLGISDWALASAKPTYTASEVGALRLNESSANADLDTILDSKTAELKPFFQALTTNDVGSARKGVLRISYNGSESQLLFDHHNRILRYRTIGSSPKSWKTLAFTDDIPTKLSQLTDDVVSGKYLPLSGGTIKGSITATSFIGNLTGNADSATYIQTKLQSSDAFYPDKYKAYIQWETGITAAIKFTDGDYQFRADSATKLATARTIWGRSFDGTKDVTGAITVDGDATFANKVIIGGISLRKVDNHLYLDSSLVLSGGVTMYGDDGTTVKPIWESIPFDRTTIDWVNGKWTVVGGVGSGGISEEFLNVTLQGYQPKITSSNKLAYSLISGTPDLSVYFLQTSFTKDNIKSTLGISDWALASAKPTYTASEVGALGVNGTAQSSLKMTAEYLTDLNNATPWRFFDMRSGYGSTDGNKPNVAWVSGITGTVTGSGNYRWQIAGTTGNARPYFRQESNGTWGNWQRLAFTTDLPTKLSQLTDDVVAGNYLSTKGGTIKGSITATSFIGNLTGNADSATKLATARTIWGQSFDGTGNITGDAIINGDLTIPNNNSIKVKSSGGVVYSVLKMSTANSLSIGQESASNGRTTMIYGNLIRLRCGTGGTDALYVNASGNVTIGASDLAGATNKMYVDGTAKFTGDTTFSSKVVIGTIPVYQSADGTLFVDANVVFRGGVAMYGNTTKTINEE